MIESENFYEDAKTEAKPTNQKGKAKVDAVTIDNTAQQIQQLQGAVKGLTKLIQGSRQKYPTTTDSTICTTTCARQS